MTFDKSYAADSLETACHIGEHFGKGVHLDMSVGS